VQAAIFKTVFKKHTGWVIFNTLLCVVLVNFFRLISCCLPLPYRWSSSVGSYYRRSCQFSLVTSCRANQLAVIFYRALHNTAPQYLLDTLRRVADILSRSHLWSSTSSHLVVRPSTPSYCRGTLVCFSWSETLEQSSGRYYYGTITSSVSKKTENLPISAILPGHYTVVSDCLRHGGPSSYFLL